MNKGFFELGLLDARGQPASDLRTDVGFFRASDRKKIIEARGLEFPPNRKFELPAFPQEQNLYCEVTLSRFRQRKSGFFTLTNGETITRNLTVFRIPDKWNARFQRWNELPDYFQALKQVLDRSTGVRVKGGPLRGKFVAENYDDVDDPKTILAKTCLLNLFAKLTVLKVPTAAERIWFSFVQQILEIGRERLIAIVDPQMGKIVRRIKDNITKFPDYKHTPAASHHKNMPAMYAVPKSKMFSIKSREENGNIQLTLGPGKDSDGQEVLLLDADIDESGELFEHIADVFKHVFTGGTHPLDIHEYLGLAHPGVPLGYELV